MAGVAVALTVLLSARRGITPRSLGLGPPRDGQGGVAGGTGFRMAIWALLALIVGGAITTALAAGKLGQPAFQDNSYTLYATAASLAAGVVEETVVLAFVVSTLRQAGRTLPEIVIVAIALRLSYHDYYGPGVVGIAVWAAVFIWLYLRTGSVIPLIIVHFFWDATIFWTQRWHWVGVAAVYVSIAVIIAAPVSWRAGGSAANAGALVGDLHRVAVRRSRSARPVARARPRSRRRLRRVRPASQNRCRQHWPAARPRRPRWRPARGQR